MVFLGLDSQAIFIEDKFLGFGLPLGTNDEKVKLILNFFIVFI